MGSSSMSSHLTNSATCRSSIRLQLPRTSTLVSSRLGSSKERQLFLIVFFCSFCFFCRHREGWCRTLFRSEFFVGSSIASFARLRVRVMHDILTAAAVIPSLPAVSAARGPPPAFELPATVSAPASSASSPASSSATSSFLLLRYSLGLRGIGAVPPSLPSAPPLPPRILPISNHCWLEVRISCSLYHVLSSLKVSFLHFVIVSVSGWVHECVVSASMPPCFVVWLLCSNNSVSISSTSLLFIHFPFDFPSDPLAPYLKRLHGASSWMETCSTRESLCVSLLHPICFILCFSLRQVSLLGCHQQRFLARNIGLTSEQLVDHLVLDLALRFF